MKLLPVIALSLFLISCSSTVTSLKEDKDKNLSVDTGYVLIGIETNQNLKEVWFDGPQDIKLTHKDLKYGTRLVLVDLKVGTYRIDKIKLNRAWHVTFDDEELWEFDVTPQGINYVGHLEFVNGGARFMRIKAELVNRSSEAIEFLEEAYPNILAKRELFYGGPGEDNFFSLLRQLEEK